MRKCAKCGWEEREDSSLDEHHLIPQGKGWKGKDDEGRILLCKHHHNELPNFLLNFVGGELYKIDIKVWGKMRKKIKSFTQWWLQW